MNLTKIVYYTIPALRHREEALLQNFATWNVPPDAIHRFEGVDGKSPDITKERLQTEMRAEGFPKLLRFRRTLGDLVYHANIRRILAYILQEITEAEAVLLLTDDAHLVRPWQDYVACVDSFPSTFEAIRFHCWINSADLPNFVVPKASKYHADFTSDVVTRGEFGLCLSHHGCRRLLEILKNDTGWFVESIEILSQFKSCYTFAYPNPHPRGSEWIHLQRYPSYREEIDEQEQHQHDSQLR